MSADEDNQHITKRSSSDEVTSLIEKVMKDAPKELTSLRFEKAILTMDWNKYVPNGGQVEQIKDKVLKVCGKVRKWRTLAEVMEDGHAYAKNPTNMLHLDPNVPKRPLTAYMRFHLEKMPKIKKKHPELETIQITKLVSKKYSELAPEKKEVYQKYYTTEKQAYDEKIAQIIQDNPEYHKPSGGASGKTRPHRAGRPPSIFSPVQAYLSEKTASVILHNPEKSKLELHKQYREKWTSLSDKKKLKYIEQAMQQKDKYYEELEEYIKLHPSYKPSRAEYLIKTDQAIWDRHLGIPEKPPTSAYHLYKKEAIEQTPKGNIIQIQSEINREWKTLSKDKQNEYDVRLKKMQKEYVDNLREYMETLEPEAREKFLSKEMNEKKEKQPSAKQIATFNSAMKLFIMEKKYKFAKKFPDVSKNELNTIMESAFKELDDTKRHKYEEMLSELNVTIASPSRPRSKPKTTSHPSGLVKPPASGYHIYYHEQKRQYDDKGIKFSKEILQKINASWSKLSKADKAEYTRQKDLLVKSYEEKLEKFDKNGNSMYTDATQDSNEEVESDGESASTSHSNDSEASEEIPVVQRKRKHSGSSSPTKPPAKRKPGMDNNNKPIYTSSSGSESDSDSSNDENDSPITTTVNSSPATSRQAQTKPNVPESDSSSNSSDADTGSGIQDSTTMLPLTQTPKLNSVTKLKPGESSDSSSSDDSDSD